MRRLTPASLFDTDTNNTYQCCNLHVWDTPAICKCHLPQMYSAEVYFFKFQYILTVFCFHEVQTRCYSYGIPAIYIVISEKFPYWKLVYKSSEENTTWVAQNSKTATQQPKIKVKIDNRRRGEVASSPYKITSKYTSTRTEKLCLFAGLMCDRSKLIANWLILCDK